MITKGWADKTLGCRRERKHLGLRQPFSGNCIPQFFFSLHGTPPYKSLVSFYFRSPRTLLAHSFLSPPGRLCVLVFPRSPEHDKAPQSRLLSRAFIRIVRSPSPVTSSASFHPPAGLGLEKNTRVTFALPRLDIRVILFYLSLSPCASFSRTFRTLSFSCGPLVAAAVTSRISPHFFVLYQRNSTPRVFFSSCTLPIAASL